MPTDETIDFLKAQVLVLHSAVGAIAGTSDNRPQILAMFNYLTERLISDLLPLPASEKLIESAQVHIADFRRILTAPETTPPRTGK